MKEERVKKLTIEALSHVDVKTVDDKNRPKELSVVLRPDCNKDLLCGLVSIMSKQLELLVLVTADLNSEMSLKLDTDAQHNNTFASLRKDLKGVSVAMNIRELSLSNWINRLSYSFCSEQPYSITDKKYFVDGSPILTICTYNWTS